MDCLPVTKIPEGPAWTYELKLDGYGLEAVNTGKEVILYPKTCPYPRKRSIGEPHAWSYLNQQKG
jgi:hypothetical protein